MPDLSKLFKVKVSSFEVVRGIPFYPALLRSRQGHAG